MKPRYGTLIKPLGQEYNNTKEINGITLIQNTSIEDVDYVNRIGVVVSPRDNSDLVEGDLVVTHHNVFRTYYDMKGNKRKSNEYIRDGLYLVEDSKIYMYNRDDKWNTYMDYCFIKPVDYKQDELLYRADKTEEDHVGIIKYINHKTLKPGDKIAFTKNSEYKFVIDEEKLYRMRNRDICIKLD
jgi:hypothetical protein